MKNFFSRLWAWIRLSRKRQIIVGAGILVLIVLVGLWVRRPRYTVLGKVEKGTLIEAVYGIATVTADKTYLLRVSQANVLNKVFVKEGQRIKKNDELVVMDGISFRSPIGGIVSLVAYKEGETVSPQAEIVSVFDPEQLYYVVSLEQQGALKVRPGQNAKLSFDSIRDKVFEGQVFAVYSHGNQFNVSISAKNLPEGVLPGMTADVGIEIAQHPDRILVPFSGIIGGELSVLKGTGLSRIPVKVGLVDAAKAEIVQGDVVEGWTVAIPQEKK
jgi:macrolide-specific efflux system membrane fusion protein